MSPSSKKNRVAVYDWLRGTGCLAVILGHYKIFGPSKSFLLWSVHVFVMVTMALAANSKLNTEKILRRLAYVLFVYTVSVCVFAPFFASSGRGASFSDLFLSPVHIFIENPYFRHLWYLCLYVQMMFFLLFSLNVLRRFSPRAVVISTLIFSQALFFYTRYVLGRFGSLLLPSWVFVMALGFYFMPQIVQKIHRARRNRPLRTGAIFLVLVLCYTQPWIKGWLGLYENRLFILNTAVFAVTMYFLTELYYLIQPVRFFQPLIRFVLLASRYTLIYYLYHQALYHLFEINGVLSVNIYLLTVICLATGLIYGFCVHEGFLWLEKKIMPSRKARPPVPAAEPWSERAAGSVNPATLPPALPKESKV